MKLQKLFLQQLLTAVSVTTEYSEKEIKETTKKVEARGLFLYLAKHELGMSITDAAKFINRKPSAGTLRLADWEKLRKEKVNLALEKTALIEYKKLLSAALA